MVIDTADKRKSAVNHIQQLSPIPDGEINVYDRIHVAGFYRGQLTSTDNINTEDKRKSAVNHIQRILPIPDIITSAADRAHIAGFYRGLFDDGDITPRRLSPNFYY